MFAFALIAAAPHIASRPRRGVGTRLRLASGAVRARLAATGSSTHRGVDQPAEIVADEPAYVRILTSQPWRSCSQPISPPSRAATAARSAMSISVSQSIDDSCCAAAARRGVLPRGMPQTRVVRSPSRTAFLRCAARGTVDTANIIGA